MGILLAWSALAGPYLTSANNTLFDVPELSFSFVVAMMPLGGAVSSIFICWLRKKIGTKIVLFLSGLTIIGGYFLFENLVTIIVAFKSRLGSPHLCTKSANAVNREIFGGNLGWWFL